MAIRTVAEVVIGVFYVARGRCSGSVDIAA